MESLKLLGRLRVLLLEMTEDYPTTCNRAKQHGFGSKLSVKIWLEILNNVNLELNDLAIASLGVRSRKLSNVRPVIGWVTKIYYLEFLRASEGTLSRWSRLHLQSFVSPPSTTCLLTSGRRPVVKTIINILNTYTQEYLVQNKHL
jgi:hypothetical protein